MITNFIIANIIFFVLFSCVMDFIDSPLVVKMLILSFLVKKMYNDTNPNQLFYAKP